MDADQVRAEWQRRQAGDLPSHGGRTLAYVYDSGMAEADAIGREALAAFGASNGLDPTAFGSLLEMEQDLVATAAQLLDGPPETVGTVTSGGFGPSLGGLLAMGYVESSFAAIGTELDLLVRGKALPAKVATMPFVPNHYFRPPSGSA